MARRSLTLAFLCAGLWSSTAVFASPAIAPDDDQSATQSETQPAQPVNAVIEWNRTLLFVLRTPGAQPPTIHSTRNFAILHAAIFDAINNIDKTFKPYAVHLSHVSPKASVQAAANQAAHDVLISLYPSFATTLDAELQQDLEQIPDGQNKTDGIQIGEAVAKQTLALRSNDGSAVTPPPFVPKNQPGDYQLTPPNFAPADFIQWPNVTPFVLRRADEFRPGPPPHLDSERYTRSFNEVKSLGFVDSTTRTPDQKQIGQFWNGNIQDFWNEIAQTAALQHHLDLARTAHLFALLNFSLADTAIAFFDTKYTYNLWRPVSAIQLADIDGNPETEPNTTWLPLSGKTAPDPSYPGAHSAISAAAAEVLRLYLGDRINFDVTSESLAGVTRHFDSFSDAAEEAGLSRIYAGQHFRFDHVTGKRLGQRVAITVMLSVLNHKGDF
jgi:membrane-associated phospholipid phosphatase